MPCRDNRDGCQTVYRDRVVEKVVPHPDLGVMRELACKYCKWLESVNEDIPLWAEVWWDKHKTEDAAIEAAKNQEAKELTDKLQLLDRLTHYERKLLGV